MTESKPGIFASRGVLTLLSVVADVAAVIALGADVLDTIVQIIAGVAFVLSLVGFLRNWSRPVGPTTALMVAVMVIATATLAYSIGHTSSPSPGQSPTAAGTLFSDEVDLKPGQAVDLESRGKITTQTGATGANDLYVSDNDLTANVNHNDLYSDSGAEADAAGRCQRLIEGNGVRRPYILPLAGQQFCFLTSDRHIAWARVAQITSEGGYNMAVRVWSSR